MKYDGSTWINQKVCKYDDVSQAQAYVLTLRAFFNKFPEFAGRDLYLVGESYAGQYIPHIAAQLLQSSLATQLKGIAVGNGCWGGGQHVVMCNGPNDDRNLIELYHGPHLHGALLPDPAHVRFQVAAIRLALSRPPLPSV